MLWSDEDLAKLRAMLDNNMGYSVRMITRKLGWGYNVDDVSGVCGAMICTGAGGAKCEDIDADGFWRMIDEGKQLKEIAKHYGVPMVAVYKKISKGRGRKTADDAEENNKEDDDMKWTPEKTEQLLQMKGEDRTAEEIADAPNETPPKRPCKVNFDVILDSVDAGKPKPVETVTETVETVTDAPTVRDPAPLDIVDLAYKAKWIADDLGFTPDHLVVDVRDVRTDIIVSGKGSSGKMYEVQLSVTDPSKFPK